MELVQYQYLEVNLIGIAMLLVIWVHMLGMGRDIRQEGQRGFSRMLWSVVAILASDSLVFLLRGNNTPESMLATHWACMVYFILHTYFGYLWMQYCFKRLYPESHLGKKARMLLLIPCLVSTALVLSSPWTGWIYALAPENRYARGPLIWVIVVASCLYWVLSTALVVRELLLQRRIREREIYETLLVFPIPTLLGNVL